jgi:hypothetical protein
MAVGCIIYTHDFISLGKSCWLIVSLWWEKDTFDHKTRGIKSKITKFSLDGIYSTS